MDDKLKESRRLAFEAAYIAFAKSGYLSPMIERGMSAESAEMITRTVALSMNESGEYTAVVPREQFAGFCMALDSILIELPLGSGWPCEFADGFNSALGECRAAIESTRLGIKIK